MRPHPRRTSTDPTSPRGWGTCDRSGFIDNLEKLQWQYEWAGTQLINKRVLVTSDMLDTPQRQLGTIILPPDPLPLRNARPENYTVEEQTFRITESGQQRYTLTGQARLESNLQGAKNAGTYPG
jgi:hypothetical protein